VFILDNYELKERPIFAKRLTQLRQVNGYTQETFAKKVGFSRGRYANYEQGRREPDFEIVKIFAGILNCTTDYLLGTNNLDSSLLTTDTKNTSTKNHIQPTIEEAPRDLIEFLEHSQVLFDGVLLTKEDKAKIKATLEIIFCDAKQQNKRKKS
jgi:transcriptional regulator with XRE-family HTH domain